MEFSVRSQTKSTFLSQHSSTVNTFLFGVVSVQYATFFSRGRLSVLQTLILANGRQNFGIAGIQGTQAKATQTVDAKYPFKGWRLVSLRQRYLYVSVVRTTKLIDQLCAF